MEQDKSRKAPVTREDLDPAFGCAEYLKALRLRAGLTTDELRVRVGARQEPGHQCPVAAYEERSRLPTYNFIGSPPYDYRKVPGIDYELLAEAARNESLPGWRGDISGNVRLAYICMIQRVENGDLTDEMAKRILSVLYSSGDGR